MIYFLVSLAVLIIVALAAYAIYLRRLVKQKEKDERISKDAEAEKRQKQTDYIMESLNVISANVINEDLNLSEATIRCKMLLDGLLLTPQQRAPFAALDSVFEKIQRFDTHAARKALSKQERQQQDQEREAIEEANRDSLTDCFKRLMKISLDDF